MHYVHIYIFSASKFPKTRPIQSPEGRETWACSVHQLTHDMQAKMTSAFSVTEPGSGHNNIMQQFYLHCQTFYREETLGIFLKRAECSLKEPRFYFSSWTFMDNWINLMFHLTCETDAWNKSVQVVLTSHQILITRYIKLK